MQPCSSEQSAFGSYTDSPLRHPDFTLDTLGAGPSRLPDPLDAAPHHFEDEDEDEDEPLAPTLGETAPWLEGLCARDIVAQEVEAKLMRGQKLSESDLLTARAFNFKVNTDMSAKAFGKMRQAFPAFHDLPSYDHTRTRMANLSRIHGVRVDYCVSSCIAFTGPYKNRHDCLHYGQARYKPDPKNPN
ncbi:hypothetical protein FS749_000788 [Ceratobasidium sp. UAMH 11750]|nr:hypothetical protein FS749_000788 [Ceratobasidium sp. UAMH 11750]